MIDNDFRQLINAAIINGELSDKKREFLKKKAEQKGYDLDELEIVIESLLIKSSSEIKHTNSEISKIGPIKRCPACGAIISFEAKCPECGYVLKSISASESVKSLYEELKVINSNDVYKKKQIIESFPIPRSKEDLLEFLTILMPKASDPNERFNNIYLSKYSECLEKSKVYFPGDPDFLPFIAKFPSLLKKTRKGSFSSFVKNHKIFVFLLFFFIIPFFVILPLGIRSENKNLDKVSTCIENNDFSGARSAAQKVYGGDALNELLDDISVQEINYLISNGNINQAKIVAASINNLEKRESVLDIINNAN